MSTAPNSNGQSNVSPNSAFKRITNAYIHSDSINESSTTPASVDDDNGQSSTWVDSLTQLDRLFSGGLLLLCYNLTDIVFLSLGLYYGTRTCSVSNAFAIISICILVVSGLQMAFTILFFVRNWPLRHMTLSDEATLSRYLRGCVISAIFQFLRFICVCVGTAYAFTSKVPVNNDCEILRFYLGIVCFNTWVLIFIRPPKPSLPVRRSLILECFIFLYVIVYYGIYFGFVTFAMIKNQKSECIYTRIEDLYFGAPLKLFAYVGLILAGCIIVSYIFEAILNQFFYRLPNLRRVFVHLSAIHYVICYLITAIDVYYYSVGAVLLFQPRSGGSCRMVAPDLYKTLLIWQLILFVLPLIILALAFLVCCLGNAVAACLSRCLPASITVPLLEILRRRVPDAPNATNPNPPASPGTIDALPMLVFGEASDEFNQTECAICQAGYETNEAIKRLPCGHLFHAHCVANWLSITRICPVCRRRITSTSLYLGHTKSSESDSLLP